MTESTLTQQLIKRVKMDLHGAVVLKHADRFTSGVPDLSITWHGKTSWWEVKYANPRFESPSIQHLTCLRLAIAGTCHYLIFTPFRIYLVPPNHLETYTVDYLAMCEKHDIGWAVQHIREAHQ